MDSLRHNSRTDQTHSPTSALSFFVSLAAALIGFAGGAFAMPVYVTPQNLPSCDPLGLTGTTATGTTLVDELGTSGFPADETILAASQIGQQVACPSNFVADPDVTPQMNVKITNATGVDFSDLWYVADPETSILNIDGLVNEQSAFKIDATGINRPLIFESFSTGIAGVFEDGETWVFIIDAYLNSSATPPEILTSVGLVGNLSGNANGVQTKSSGSIIGTPVPEPGTALLMSLGLMGLSVAGRERRGSQSPRTSRRKRRKRRAHLAGPIATLSTSALMLVALSTPAAAQVPLTGNGASLQTILPAPNPDPFWDNNQWTSIRIPDPANPGLNPSGATLSLLFDPPAGTALRAPWVGNFQHTVGTGLGNTDLGLNTFNFGGLAGDVGDPGTLAMNSLFSISDLDDGSGAAEQLRLVARDAALAVITDPWLSEPIAAFGTPSELSTANAFPSWQWDGSSYLFTGNLVYFNPNVLLRFTTLVAIHELDIDKLNSSSYGVSFGAQVEPIPEPSTALLVGLGLGVLTHRKARSRGGVS